MSKLKRLPNKKTGDQKLTNHYSSLSLLNTNSINTLSQLPDRLEGISESPYAKKVVKVRSNSIIKERSTSIIKDSSMYQPSGLVSPPLNPKFNMSLKSKINLTSSFVQKIKDVNEVSMKTKPKQVNNGKRKNNNEELYFLELKIEKISEKHKENGISNEILDSYRECFEEIIFKDKQFGSVLAKIKLAYDD